LDTSQFEGETRNKSDDLEKNSPNYRGGSSDLNDQSAINPESIKGGNGESSNLDISRSKIDEFSGRE
jgi:hypothetical protein